MARHLLLVLVVLLLAAPDALAQRRAGDPRPLHGAPPRVEPLGAATPAALAAPRGALTDHAVQHGTAGRVPLRPSQLRRLAPGAAPTAATFDAALDLRLERAENGTVRWLSGDIGHLGVAGKAASASAQATAALDVLGGLAFTLRLEDPAAELQLLDVAYDALGARHLRFEQTYAGLPVWGRDLYVHTDADGAIYAVNGRYEPTPSGLATTAPALEATAARQAAVDDLRADGRWAPPAADVARQLGLEDAAPRLVLYPDRDGRVHLAYEVGVRPNLLEWFTYFVDARTGDVLHRFGHHCAVQPFEDAPVLDGSGLALPAATDALAAAPVAGTFGDGFGTDLNGQTQNFRVFQNPDGTFYLLSDLDNLQPGGVTLPNIPSLGGAVMLSAENQDLTAETPLYFLSSHNNQWSDPAGVSAHVNMELAYGYYKQTFGRRAINAQDESLISIVHVTSDGASMENAFWSGRIMAYGDGGNQFSSLAGSVDVAAHEMTHGVVQHTAGLIYEFQSGALNESFADVFGVMVDRDDFLVGDDIIRPGYGPALRDLARPDNPALAQPQPAHMNTYQDLPIDYDNGGVHINSGIPNRAAYLLIQSLGHAQTEQIYYRALSHYLTRNSDFVDCRNAVVQAAQDLYGDAAASAARAAFDGVGIFGSDGGGGGNGGGGHDGGANDVPPVAGGSPMITFMLEDGTLGVFNLASGEAYTFSDPGARARVSDGDFAQLSTPLTGERIWFINPDGHIAYVEVETGAVSTLPGVNLQQDGDLWNASVAPDESWLALVSAYSEDPNLYFFDGEQMLYVEIAPEGTQSGFKVHTVKYPDVVSWSPNAAAPRIALDAYSEVQIAGTAVGYWSMFEINFATGKVYDLIPSQPAELSAGNITYSRTNPDVVAFNLFEQDGDWDVYVGNFETGSLEALDLPTYTVDGQPITDAQRPTFAPDDAMLAMTSPSLGLLLFYEAASGDLLYTDFEAALYNPHWFVFGGEVTTPVEDVPTPAAFALTGNYPNPFNPATTITYTLPEPAAVRLRVYDALGREVALLVDAPQPAGAHAAPFDARGLPSGTYLYRLEAGAHHATGTMVLVK